MNKHRREQKRAIAEKNRKRRAGTGAREQLAILDSRLGRGIGAIRERARLHTLINAKKQHRDQAESS